MLSERDHERSRVAAIAAEYAARVSAGRCCDRMPIDAMIPGRHNQGPLCPVHGRVDIYFFNKRRENLRAKRTAA